MFIYLVISAPAPLEVPQGEAPLHAAAVVVVSPPPPPIVPVLQPAALCDQVQEEEEEEDGGRAAPVRRGGRDPAEAVMPRHLQWKNGRNCESDSTIFPIKFRFQMDFLPLRFFVPPTYFIRASRLIQDGRLTCLACIFKLSAVAGFTQPGRASCRQSI